MKWRIDISMKKFLFVIVALLVVNSAFSQVIFGIKAGINVSSLSDFEQSVMSIRRVSVKMFVKDGMSTGFHAGSFVNFSLGNVIGLQPELLISQQGGKQKPNPSLKQYGSGLPDDLKISCQFAYLHLPILLEIKPVANFGILMGPQLGLNFYKKYTETQGIYTSSVSDSDFDEEFGNSFKNFDAGIVFGLQCKLMNKITIGARYNLGLTNCLDGNMDIDMNNIGLKGWKNNVLQVSLGILLNN